MYHVYQFPQGEMGCSVMTTYLKIVLAVSCLDELSDVATAFPHVTHFVDGVQDRCLVDHAAGWSARWYDCSCNLLSFVGL